MPRTKGSKNRPKTNTTKDYASQIAEKQESITSLTAEMPLPRSAYLLRIPGILQISLQLLLPMRTPMSP